MLSRLIAYVRGMARRRQVEIEAALIAGLVPARHAFGIDPVEALRHE